MSNTSRMSTSPARPSPSSQRTLRVLIVGAGFGGIAAAIELRRHGIDDVTILEKAPDLGGTWYYNTYPGAACDVPSHLYSFSYAQRSDWSRLCSPQREIHQYLHEVARTQGIDRLIHTDTAVESCAWDEERCRWSVHTDRGTTHEADVLIVATGQLHRPVRPAIAGADTFAGHSFHSAEWDHAYSLAGKRVGVVGTGASAVQFVPEIAPLARSLTIFQRTGNWFLPRRNRTLPRAGQGRHPERARTAGAAAPVHVPLHRVADPHHPPPAHPWAAARRALGRVHALPAQDPDIREQAWPDYTFGCKRILFSSSFLPALQRSNVALVTEHDPGHRS